MSHPISKTDYIRWRECRKDAWLAIHNPELYYSYEPSAFELALRETGAEVEEIARRLFSDGVFVWGHDKAAHDQTHTLIDEKTPTIFQAVFLVDGFLAVADVLKFNIETGGFTIYEIKSASHMKKEYLYDVAFQVMLLDRCGLKIDQAHLTHLNSDYVRQGDLDPHNLFSQENITPQIDEMKETVTREMEDSMAYLLSEAEPVGQCDCIYRGRSNHCTTFNYSNPRVPEYGIHDISRIGSSPKKLRELVDLGKFELDEIPTHVQLTENQQIQVDTYKSGQVVIQRDAIATELNGLKFPLYFIDYETHMATIPLFDGWSPNKQVPFEYSLHIVEALGVEPAHREFLHAVLKDPDVPFATSLHDHIGSEGNIIVWHKAFECGTVNKYLSERHPEYTDFFADFEARVYDLEDVFSKRLYVDRGFLGRSSIKNVLPVLVPELSYKELDIRDGTAASVAWPKLVSGELSDAQFEDLCQALRKYCGLDSYAMYAIWIGLSKLVGAAPS